MPARDVIASTDTIEGKELPQRRWIVLLPLKSWPRDFAGRHKHIPKQATKRVPSIHDRSSVCLTGSLCRPSVPAEDLAPSLSPSSRLVEDAEDRVLKQAHVRKREPTLSARICASCHHVASDVLIRAGLFPPVTAENACSVRRRFPLPERRWSCMVGKCSMAPHLPLTGARNEEEPTEISKMNDEMLHWKVRLELQPCAVRIQLCRVSQLSRARGRPARTRSIWSAQQQWSTCDWEEPLKPIRPLLLTLGPCADWATWLSRSRVFLGEQSNRLTSTSSLATTRWGVRAISNTGHGSLYEYRCSYMKVGLYSR